MHSLTYKKQTSLGFRSYKTPAFFFCFCFFNSEFHLSKFSFQFKFFDSSDQLLKKCILFYFSQKFFFKRGWLHFFDSGAKLCKKNCDSPNLQKRGELDNLKFFFAPRLFFSLNFAT